jgi:hypothetical protein
VRPGVEQRFQSFARPEISGEEHMATLRWRSLSGRSVEGERQASRLGGAIVDPGRLRALARHQRNVNAPRVRAAQRAIRERGEQPVGDDVAPAVAALDCACTGRVHDEWCVVHDGHDVGPDARSHECEPECGEIVGAVLDLNDRPAT